MKTLILILAACAFGYGQSHVEIVERTGIVTAIRYGGTFALGGLEMKIGDEDWRYWIPFKYGKSITSKIKVGDRITFKTVMNKAMSMSKEDRVYLGKNFPGSTDGGIHEIKIGNEWIPTPTLRTDGETMNAENHFVFLEQKIISDYYLDGLRKALIFENGRVAFAYGTTPEMYPMKNTSPGDIISFVGHRSPVKEGYVYPIEGVKDVYSFGLLTKIEVPITSFFYQEDFTRIGLVANQKRLSFPSEFAQKIESFANGEKVVIYFLQSLNEKFSRLDLYALVRGRDTLRVSPIYYFPDKHNYRPVEIDGEITAVTHRESNGMIINMMVGKDCFVEVNSQMASQLGSLLTKGQQVKISGDERIRIAGEVFEKDYHIIIPRGIEIDGKTFILKVNPR